MRRRLIYLIFILVLGVVAVLSACNSKNSDPVQNRASENTVQQYSNAVLTEKSIDVNNDKKNEKISVKMTSGEYYVENSNSGWRGNYVAELSDESGKSLSQLNLNQAFSMDKINFTGSFDISFEDYNGDGLMDFCLGQRKSDGLYTYRLFSIKGTGEIYVLPIKNTDEITSNFYGFSAKFKKVDNTTFKYTHFDSTKNKNIESVYSWDGNEFSHTSDNN